MKQIFSLDSKFMQMLTQLGDYILLNILYLICCIPIVTIGAANSALHRVMFEMMEDRGNTYKKFFKCFFGDFKAATGLFLVKNAVVLFLVWDLYLIWNNNIPLPRELSLIAVALFLLLWLAAFSSVGAQVAMFNSTFGQYFKNGLYIALTHPIKALLVALMEAFPILFFLLDPALFALFGPLWLFLYFSVTTNLAVRMWKKPFDFYMENAEKE